MSIRLCASALVAFIFAQAPLVVMAQQPGHDLGDSFNSLNFGRPTFMASAPSRRLFERIHRREQHLLETARWMSLEEAVQTALTRNPELAAAYSEIESRRWSVNAVRRRWNPSFDLAPGDYGSLQRGSSSESNSQGGLYAYAWIEWSFFNPTVSPGIHAALSDLKSQRLLFDVAARNLVLSVQTTYYGLQEQFKLYNHYRLLALLTARLLDDASALRSKSEDLDNELAQLRATQHAQMGLLINASRSLYEASYELSTLIGEPDSAMILAGDALVTNEVWNEDVSSTIAQATRFREEVKSALELSKAERWRSSELMASYWPRLSLIAGNTFSLSESFPVYGLGVNWSLDGGRNHAEAAARRSAARTHELNAKSAQLEIAAEIRKAHDRLSVSALNLENSATQIEESWKAFHGAMQLFRSKLVGATTLIQSQAQLVDAIAAQESARREYNTSMAQLYRYSARWPATVRLALDDAMPTIERQSSSPAKGPN